MIFTTEGFFEVAIESWPVKDLNPRPLNSVQAQFSVRFHFGHFARQSPRLF